MFAKRNSALPEAVRYKRVESGQMEHVIVYSSRMVTGCHLFQKHCVPGATNRLVLLIPHSVFGSVLDATHTVSNILWKFYHIYQWHFNLHFINVRAEVSDFSGEWGEGNLNEKELHPNLLPDSPGIPAGPVLLCADHCLLSHCFACLCHSFHTYKMEVTPVIS